SERFVVAIEREHHIRRDVLQVLGIIGESLIAGALVDHVARKAHVPEADVLVLEMVLQNRLYPGSVLHPVRKTIPENRDRIVLLEREPLGGCCKGRDPTG
ncbi:MAG: hypothetical protein KDA84_01940, partial [Planctomycetaceae bacterium]|nr:hypothetical protein [Planctomycetaceae bacterium]